MKALCSVCHVKNVPDLRSRLGYRTCLACGEQQARAVVHTSVPMNKSNYIYVSDHDVLKQLNPKRTI